MAKQFMHIINVLAGHKAPSLPIGENLIVTALAYLTYFEAKHPNAMITLIASEVITLSDPPGESRKILF